jgi:hypothetical protein
MTRKWFQIHLSTAIVLMFVAGGFIGANVLDRKLNLNNAVFHFKSYMDAEYMGQGWPLIVTYASPRPLADRFSLAACFINILCGAGALLPIAVASESLIRRREIKKP